MFIIRPHKDDSNVFEIVTKTERGISVWAIVLKDFLYDAQIEDPEIEEHVSLALKAGKEFECELSMKEKQQ